MNKSLGYILLLVTLTGVVLASLFYPILPAMATVPTPTPTIDIQEGAVTGPADTLCHLAINKDCMMINPLDEAVNETGPQKSNYPAMGAQGVPTYTLISATFEQALDPSTLTPETFFVSQGNTRLAGSISYIPVSQMAIFQPAEPLNPATTYTATLSPAVRDLTGLPLGESRVWTFTTISGGSTLRQGLAAAGVEEMANLNPYIGDIHSHTSYSDGVSTPADAFATARANGVDFFAVTEHGFMMTQAEWQNIRQRADIATVNGQFVAIPGFEYSHELGHINVFDSETYIHRNDPKYDTLAEFYAWLVDHPTAFAQFNHPKDNDLFNWNFNDFVYYPQADLKMVLQELETADQFFLSLNKGWHLGTLKNHDTHRPDWGSRPYMGVWATNLTQKAILDALRSRRSFFISPTDPNFVVGLQANGVWMGSAIPNTNKINFTVIAYDPDPQGKSLRMYIYDNGVRVAGTTLPSSGVYTWKPAVTGKLGHYYYAEVFHEGWLYPAYSSPIWVERPPLAEAGPNQLVIPGATVKLKGGNSYDPDGDALAYRWTRQGGTPVSLQNATTAQPSFVAPTIPGEVVLQLTVTDPGGLKASDQTRITITNKPVLAIRKTGPAASGPDDRVTYRLRVTNHGISPATQVHVTDTLPVGATYISGGTLKGNVVSWSGLTIPPNGGVIQLSFTVASDKPLVNFNYRATCPNCIAAQGSEAVFTNWGKVYLPLILH